MHNDCLEVLRILADSRFHSGQAIAERLRTSRALVCKRVGRLRECGLDIHAVTGKGYKLTESLELLDQEHILASLAAAAAIPTRFDVCFETSSTNQVLLERLSDCAIHKHVCMTEYQSAGRGRRGRRWVAPLAHSLCLSVGWHLNSQPDSATALSLAVGVGLMRVLGRFGVQGAGLKWPNDVLWRGRKLAGILIELKGESAGPCQVVIGIGLNVRAAQSMQQQIEQPWIGLVEILERDISRNQLAAAIVGELFDLLPGFETNGFSRFASEWRVHDLAQGKTVKLDLPGEAVIGQAQGVDMGGALLLSVNGQIRRYVSGDVSLQLAA